MGRPFEFDDVVGGGAPSWKLLVARGLMRRCPRCGDPDVFVNRWQLRDRCPDCGYRFVREPGFRLGAWFLNFMLLQFLLLGMGFGFILWAANHPDTSLWPALIVGGAVCVVVPIAFYPTSRTLWAAIDLGMTPLELEEIVDAADAVTPARDGLSGEATPDSEPTTEIDEPDDDEGPGEGQGDSGGTR